MRLAHPFLFPSVLADFLFNRPCPSDEACCRPYLGFHQAASAALFHDGGGTITIMVTYEQA